MKFSWCGTGGNSAGSEWISAEGNIEDDTVSEFEAFLEDRGISGPREIRINSVGGNLEGGIRLGEFIRKHGFSTVAGSTGPDEYGHEERLSGTCQSAASMVFIAGKNREADAGDIGVHQFYYPDAIQQPEKVQYNSIHLSEDQAFHGFLVDYIARMGVDVGFIAKASATTPDDMYFFSEDELNRYRIRWQPWEYEPWQLLPWKGGIIARSVTRDGSEWAEIFAKPDLSLRLYRPLFDDREWIEGALSVMDGIRIYGQVLPSAAMTYHQFGNCRVLDVSLASLDIRRVKDCTITAVLAGEGPRYMWGGFCLGIPVQEASTMMALAMKNPISD